MWVRVTWGQCDVVLVDLVREEAFLWVPVCVCVCVCVCICVYIITMAHIVGVFISYPQHCTCTCTPIPSHTCTCTYIYSMQAHSTHVYMSTDLTCIVYSPVYLSPHGNRALAATYTASYLHTQFYYAVYTTTLTHSI